MTALASFFFLNETLAAKVDGKSEAAKPMSTWEVLKSPGVGMVLYIYGHTMGLALAYTAVSPVFLFTSVEKGGFGFSDAKIAGFLCVAGGSQALYMLLAFPPLQKRFGTGGVLRACAIIWPLMMASYPLFNELLRHGMTTVFWILLPISLIIGSGVSMSFGTLPLPINEYIQQLITHSLRPTLHQRHLALKLRTRDRQRPSPDSQQRRSRLRSGSLHQPLRRRRQAEVGRRASGLVRDSSASAGSQRSSILLARESRGEVWEGQASTTWRRRGTLIYYLPDAVGNGRIRSHIVGFSCRAPRIIG